MAQCFRSILGAHKPVASVIVRHIYSYRRHLNWIFVWTGFPVGVDKLQGRSSENPPEPSETLSRDFQHFTTSSKT